MLKGENHWHGDTLGVGTDTSVHMCTWECGHKCPQGGHDVAEQGLRGWDIGLDMPQHCQWGWRYGAP